MPTKVEQLQAQLREVSTKALAIVDDDKKTMKAKAAELAPLEQQINHLESEIKDYQYVAEKRRTLGAADLGAEGHQIPGSLPERRNPSTIAKAWGEKVQNAIEDRVRRVGGDTKALINGQIDIPSIIREATQIPGRPSSILQLIPQGPARRTSDPGKNDGNTFGYLVQTARDLNAGSVPDGARKPTSGITFEEKEDRYRVYAHLTDPMPKRYLDDYRNLISILKTQLGLGLIESLEYDILLGSGVLVPEVTNAQGVVTTQGEDPVLGILNTPGILTKAWATGATPLKQLTSARYQLEDTFITPNAWVINSKDYQALVELRENGETGALLFGTGRTSLDQLLGDYDRIVTPLIPQGTALLGDFQQTELIPREDDHLDIDGSGPLFDRNQVKLRHEGRYGFATNQPSAFIKVALKA